MPTAGYDTALNIVSDAAIELGLGAQTVVFASTDPNVIQLRTVLKSAGRKMVIDHDWTHLQQQQSFVTRPNWVKSTVYVTAASAVAWVAATPYVVGDLRKNAGNLYQCTTAGTSSSVGPGPNTQASSIADGTGALAWKFLNTGAASIVVHGQYYYTCTTAGTSGTIGPLNVGTGTETDGTVVWTWTGLAADYALPADFSNMIDQTGWNRTNRLPLGGPSDPQEWQYLLGRQTSIVFTVLFRQVLGLFRVFPVTDPPGGYNIAYEYQSTFWTSATGGTVPTANAPTVDSDIIYFDPLLIKNKVKLDWLKMKGLPSDYAQREYDETLEAILNTDSPAQTLSLGRGRRFDPLVGGNNLPITGYGS